MNLQDEIRHLAEQLHPALKRGTISVGQGTYPKHLSDQGIYQYRDGDTIYFTIAVDHPTGMDRGERNGSKA